MKYKVVIADDETIMRLDISEMLNNAGYDVVAQAKDGIEAVKLCEDYRPDLVVMDVKMPLLDGLSAAKQIIGSKYSLSVLLLTAYSEQELVQTASEIGAQGYVVKPIDERSLIPAVELAIANGRKQQELGQQLEKLKGKFEDRKYIDRAKGVLMSKQQLTEDEAYKTLRTIAMEKRLTMSELSRILIGE
ncbi:ANTAR domain-containing response regulator [Streptococcus ratti]|uniref:Response regulator receiver/ANTAR domain-containing protein n=1 Tax=Streptococcus ratti FA-1 = DSM 20564 TaxID=699248 RepID=A0ABN0GTX2_STRRT|nr:response regulator [Streptococcus ratti]EJN93718.1 response regulator receiver/ANTAR domain-containing protein [Streptococcus ratti FA-1 = DSM 20564]EMP70609.1 transcription antiterminator response regulator [Streptococcus ratti FA-1 = DSM 20564]QEY07573.1 response regulator [Streptococcus ratti]VEI60030.1 two-component response regulator [Streptococcus mutans]